MTPDHLALVGARPFRAPAPPGDPVTIVVRDGRIVRLQAPESATPPGARVVDVGGALVMPGLVDMHLHLWDGRQGPSLLAHGITTVRDMWGSPAALRWRDEVAAGSTLGPRVVCASPLMDGRLSDGSARYPGVAPVDDVDEAAARVDRHAEQGYDAIKVYTGLDGPRLRAAAHRAEHHGLPVVGHCPTTLSLEEAVRSGLHGVEHLAEWQNGRLVTGVEPLPAGFVARSRALVQGTDWASVARLADALRAADATVCPTLGVWGVVGDRGPDHADDPAMALAPRRAVEMWGRRGIRPAPGETPDDVKHAAAALREHLGQVVAVLHDHGVRLVVGTDAGSIWTVAGPSYRAELMHLANHVPAAAVLTMATSAAAEDLGARGPGTPFEPGSRADLLVLDEDPLTDVTAVTRPAMVVAAGQLHDRSTLLQWRRDREAHVDQAMDEQDDMLGAMASSAWFDRGR